MKHIPLINAKPSGYLKYIFLKINGIKANAMIDGGATLSAISRKFL